MRVKKLSANRRPKAGDEDDSNSSSSSPTAPSAAAKWISPSKSHQQQHLNQQQLLHQRGAGSDIGSSSPTDPTGVHPLELADVHLTPPRLRFSDVIAMANSQHPHHLHQQQSVRDGAASAGTSARKSLASGAAKKAAASGSSSGASWRDQVPGSVRDGIHAKIVEHLKALKPNAPEAVLARLPGLASRMEKTLLQLASSQEEFVDAKSLASRLGAIQQSSAKKLLQQQTAPLPSPHGSSASAAPSAVSFSATDAALRSRTPLSEDQARFVFQCLQSWRQKLVNIYGVAPWEILPNSILAKVAVYAPSTEQELSICGVRDELIARFGSSLLKELQLICGSTASARGASASPAAGARNGGAKASRKAESSKRPQEPKKRKTSVLAPADTTASRLAPTNSFLMPTVPAIGGSNSSSSTSSNTMLPLFRAAAGVDSLPALLPSASAMKSPAQLFAPRLPSPPSSAIGTAAHVSEELHHSMHLLAQGAGRVSQQQQDAQTIGSYEKELQETRWQLEQLQQENERLRAQVQQLQQQRS